ncbi:MAG TPA: DUF2946 family protein [Burkholderiales bacterium]|nr:DUF2946 family protein [Burkholderiales bacterium]
MDEAVLRSIAKWPNVPAVYGWLQLKRRGRDSLATCRPFAGTAATRRSPDRFYGGRHG